MNEVLIAPSILSADFTRLGEELMSVASAEWVHVDVMDGHFVPNITIGPMIVDAVRRSLDAEHAEAPNAKSRRVIDVHLMIEPVDPLLEAFVAAGADIVTVHAEACKHLDRTLSAIRALGAKAGVALNPATPVDAVQHLMHRIDLVLAMTVNPGFGGQSYLSSVEPKVTALRSMIGDRPIYLEVDGGITATTAAQVVAAGADVLVAGSAVFGATDRTSAISALRQAATR